MTRTVQILNATMKVAAIVQADVVTPPPAGKTFVKVTDDNVQVECFWIYDPGTGTFSPPEES